MNKNWFELGDGTFICIESIMMISSAERTGDKPYLVFDGGVFGLTITKDEFRRLLPLIVANNNVVRNCEGR